MAEPDTAEAAAPVLGARGELTLVLDGSPMGLRPSYEAIEAIEAATGRGLIDLARDALGGRLSLGATAQIATECIRAWGREHENGSASGANAKRVAKLILDSDEGFHGTLQTLSAMLSLAVTGGYDSSGELRPSTKTTTTGGASVGG